MDNNIKISLAFSGLPLLNGSNTQIYDCNDGAYMQYTVGALRSDFTKYNNALTDSGYVRLSSSEFENASYAVYNNKSAGKSVFVSFTDSDRVFRVTVSPLRASLPVEPEKYVKVCEPEITMLAIGYPWTYDASNGPFGASFVIRLPDGRFVIIDGGTGEESEVERLHDFLASSKMQKNGKTVIAAWILTHPDGDHWSCFCKFVKKYADETVLENIIYNIYAPSAEDAAMKTAAKGAGARVHDIYVPEAARAVGCDRLIKIHTGEKFYFCDLLFEVMYTQEDLYPVPLTHTNDASVVIKLTSSSGKRFLLVADIEGAGARQLNLQCGNSLRADYIQVAHHGWRGNSREEIYFNAPHYEKMYNLAAADYALWTAHLDDLHYGLLVKADETKSGSIRWLQARVKKTYSTKDGNQTICL